MAHGQQRMAYKGTERGKIDWFFPFSFATFAQLDFSTKSPQPLKGCDSSLITFHKLKSLPLYRLGLNFIDFFKHESTPL